MQDIPPVLSSFLMPTDVCGAFTGCNVVALARDYQWAIIVGSSKRYFWVLSRNPPLTDRLKAKAVSVTNR